MKVLWWLIKFDISKTSLFIREWLIGFFLLIVFIVAQIYNDNNKVLDNYSIYKKGESSPVLVGEYSSAQLKDLLTEPYSNKNIYPDKTFFDRTGNIHFFKDGTRVEIVEIYNYPFAQHLDPGWLTFKYYFLALLLRGLLFFLLRRVKG